MTGLVHQLNDFSPYWADAMWRAVWQGGLAIVIVWVLCSILPKVPARVRCWLWRLAFAKMLVCLFWAAPIRIPLLPAAKTPASVDQIARAAEVHPPTSSPTRVQLTQPFTNPEPPQNAVRPGILTWVLIFWALGVIAGLAGIVRQWWLARRLIRNSRRLDHGPIEIDVVLLSEHFGLRSLPDVRVADGLGTPLLAGFRRPAILVPQSFLKTKSPAQLRMMLAHELAHIKRGDLWWTWLAIATRVLLFFHPLVWLAKRESRLTEEMAADEMTVTVCHLKPVDYAGMLLEVSANPFPAQKVELAVGIVGSHKTLKRRLQAMKYISSTSGRQIIAAAIVITIIAAGVIVPWRIIAREPANALPKTPTNPPVTPHTNTIEMKRYKSEEWNFAIDIPMRWNAFPPVSSDSPYELIRFISIEDGTYLTIYRTPYDPKVSLKEYAGEISNGLAGAGFGNLVFGQTTIGSRQAITLDCDKSIDGRSESGREYLMADGTMVYALGFATSKKASMFELCDRMAKSFEILAEP